MRLIAELLPVYFSRALMLDMHCSIILSRFVFLQQGHLLLTGYRRLVIDLWRSCFVGHFVDVCSFQCLSLFTICFANCFCLGCVVVVIVICCLLYCACLQYAFLLDDFVFARALVFMSYCLLACLLVLLVCCRTLLSVVILFV